MYVKSLSEVAFIASQSGVEVNNSSQNLHTGNYLLLEKVGQSDFAEIYLGRHRDTQQIVAVKRLYGRMLDEEAEIFLQRTEELVGLQHRHIVSVLDYGIEDDTAYLVMDYAPQGSLRDRHPKGTRIPLETALDYVQQIASALQYIHDRGLVHRDIKPHNMLIGMRGEVMLSDFGAMISSYSLQVRPGRSYLKHFEGTVLYTAPEQLQGKPRRSSDQYALAIVIYEWLCGTWPFSGSFHEVAHQHLFVSPLPLQHHGYACPPNIERVLLRALEKDPSRRFSTITQFADELQWAYKVAQAKGYLSSPIPSTPATSNETEPISVHMVQSARLEVETKTEKPLAIKQQFRSPTPFTPQALS